MQFFLRCFEANGNTQIKMPQSYMYLTKRFKTHPNIYVRVVLIRGENYINLQATKLFIVASATKEGGSYMGGGYSAKYVIATRSYEFLYIYAKSHGKYHTFEDYYICSFSKLRHKVHQKVWKCSLTFPLQYDIVTFYENCTNNMLHSII